MTDTSLSLALSLDRALAWEEGGSVRYAVAELRAAVSRARELTRLEGRHEVAQVLVAVDAGVGAPRQLVGIEEVLLPEPRLDPRVEAGAEPRRG